MSVLWCFIHDCEWDSDVLEDCPHCFEDRENLDNELSHDGGVEK